MDNFKRFSQASLFALAFVLIPFLARASSNSFIGPLSKVDRIASTVPPNGDVNPYGVAVVPASMGKLIQGHILVSNFNNNANLQGTGTTIVQIGPGGGFSVFAHISAKTLPGACPGGVGLTTALAVLRTGWVIVGSLPTSDGTAATAKAGCLLVLNKWGQVVETLSGSLNGAAINGPWDMTALDLGPVAELFVTNVLNGTVAAKGSIVNRGTVVRIVLFIPESGKPQEILRTVVGSGFAERTDPNALVIGPTGVGLSANGTLYVADTLANRIAAIPQAVSRFTSDGRGTTVSKGGALNGPLGLSIAPNGDILATNGGDGNLVEVTPGGSQVVKTIDTSGQGAGTLFGLAVNPAGTGVYFIDDGDNTLDILH
jgi:hypothetical protein